MTIIDRSTSQNGVIDRRACFELDRSVLHKPVCYVLNWYKPVHCGTVLGYRPVRNVIRPVCVI